MRSAAAILARRLAISIAAFTAIHSYLAIEHDWHLRKWMIDIARAAGAQPIFESRVLAWGPDGPFFGQDWKTRVFNHMATRGATWIELVTGLLAAIAAYTACLYLERQWWTSYRGETRCGGCGYGLTGLKEIRCPECGKRI